VTEAEIATLEPGELQRREWIDALNTALAVVRAAEAEGRPFPGPEWSCYRSLNTWEGVIANLMALCGRLWDMAEGLAAWESEE
jgi:hypothetical protein